MSSDQDKSQKTEEPTEKKLEDARRKGNTAQSREVSTLAGLLTLALVAGVAAPAASAAFIAAMIAFIEAPEGIRLLDLSDALGSLWGVVSGMAVVLAATAAVMFAGAAVGAAFQGELLIAPDRLRPKLERISPKAGFKRLFGPSAFVEFGKGVLKLSAVAIAVGWILLEEWPRAEAMVGMSIGRMPGLMQDIALRLLLAAALIAGGIAVADRLWKSYEWRQNQRMTKQEVKDERKQTDGDPMLKARMRFIGRQRIRKRMMVAVPSATVVVVNPTHYAVALRYERGVDAAPICVAKGLDRIALKIREIAEENRVPVIENPPLARALHAASEIDAAIPTEHYQAVAEIISFVLGLRGRRGG